MDTPVIASIDEQRSAVIYPASLSVRLLCSSPAPWRDPYLSS